MGSVYAYCRVSSPDQNEDRQIICKSKFQVCCFRGAGERGDEDFIICFMWVADILYCLTDSMLDSVDLCNCHSLSNSFLIASISDWWMFQVSFIRWAIWLMLFDMFESR